jgi:hypothetical protein
MANSLDLLQIVLANQTPLIIHTEEYSLLQDGNFRYPRLHKEGLENLDNFHNHLMLIVRMAFLQSIVQTYVYIENKSLFFSSRKINTFVTRHVEGRIHFCLFERIHES